MPTQPLNWPTITQLRADKSALRAARAAAFPSELAAHRELLKQQWIGAVHFELDRAHSSVEPITSISVFCPGESDSASFILPAVITELAALLPGVQITGDSSGTSSYITLDWSTRA